MTHSAVHACCPQCNGAAWRNTLHLVPAMQLSSGSHLCKRTHLAGLQAAAHANLDSDFVLQLLGQQQRGGHQPRAQWVARQIAIMVTMWALRSGRRFTWAINASLYKVELVAVCAERLMINAAHNGVYQVTVVTLWHCQRVRTDASCCRNIMHCSASVS